MGSETCICGNLKGVEVSNIVDVILSRKLCHFMKLMDALLLFSLPRVNGLVMGKITNLIVGYAFNHILVLIVFSYLTL
jgi:hypothetical protein